MTRRPYPPAPALGGLLVLLLTLCLPTALHAAAAPLPAEDEFYFVVLGDSQFDDPPAFNRMIDDVRALRPAFVVQVGDMISGYTDDADRIRAEWQRFRNQIAPLDGIPFFPVAGNHDTYGAARKPSDTMERLYRETWGQPYHSFRYRNSAFYVLNSDSVAAPQDIGPAQLLWLRTELEGSNAEHAFVFLHRPPTSLANHDALHELLSAHPVRYVFFGHLHHHHHYVRDGIHYVMTNASGNSPLSSPETGNVDHFLHVHVRDAEVGFAGIHADSVIRPLSVSPETNVNVFRVQRALDELAEVPASRLTRQADGSYNYRLLLSNPTATLLHAYLTWDSPDRRWHIGPERGARVTLPAQTRGKAIEFTFSRPDGSRPEGWPQCHVRIPMLTSAGNWVEASGTIRIIDGNAGS